MQIFTKIKPSQKFPNLQYCIFYNYTALREAMPKGAVQTISFCIMEFTFFQVSINFGKYIHPIKTGEGKFSTFLTPLSVKCSKWGIGIR